MDVGAELQAAAEVEVAEAEVQETVAAVPQERGASPAGPEAAPVQMSSYAGPTPSSAADAVFAPEGRFGPSEVAPRSPELDALIARYANHYQVPEELVRRVVKR